MDTVNIKNLKAKSKTSSTEVEYWKHKFRKGQGIPSPIINKGNLVVGFVGCFLALKEMGFEEIHVNDENEMKMLFSASSKNAKD